MSLRRSDFRKIFRLLGSVRQSSADAETQRAQLQWLSRRLNASSAVAVGVALSSTESDAIAPHVVQLGSFGSPQVNAAAWEGCPLVSAIRKLPGRAHARLDSQLLPDKQWQQQSAHQQLWAGTGAARFIVAGHRRPGQPGVQVIILGRTEAEKPFSSHDLAVLKFFNAELHNLYAEAAKPLLPPDLPVEVTRRQREVLTVLLEGCGVKETAKRLNISPRTVEDHIKALYQLFGVHSRSALMARFIR